MANLGGLARGALAGIRVVDLTQFLSGPFCTMLLADLGADVIKVEKPAGDDFRRESPLVNGQSMPFLMVNRNKRSLGVNLRKPEGVEAVRSLISTADVVVENLRPGALDGIGLGYEALHAEFPGLIYCSITGYGQSGPYASRRGFDLVAQGMSGIMSVTGHPDTPPAKAGVPITDLNAGLFAAFGILTAYIHRQRTGQGQLVDSSLMEAGIAYTVWESAVYFATGQVPGPLGSAHRLSAPYQALRTSDGYINVGGANQSNWERICRVLGREELLTDPRFLDGASRRRNYQVLAAELEQTLAARTSQQWLAAFNEAGVPAGPIYDLSQMYNDPHVAAREMAIGVEHPLAGGVRNIGFMPKLSGTPGTARRPPPLLGQHNAEVLREIGYTDDQIAALANSGVIHASVSY